jgi:hypothetical protein
MLKYVTYHGDDSEGNPLVRALFPLESGDRTKLAYAGSLHPEVRAFIDGLVPKAGKLFVLVNAVGAGEYYGSNINGDYFEEDWLLANLHKFDDLDPRYMSRPCGYKTFLDAGVYRHHKNKDPLKSMGAVVLAVFNEYMHRVELVLEIDRARAIELGHTDVIDALDNGENLAVSMGCKVPYDECSVCSFRSKTLNDKCACVRGGMNRVLDSGEKVFVKNPFPKFFDISFVLVGADRTSFSMVKLASANVTLPSDRAAVEAGIVDPDVEKVAYSKLSKLAEKIKRVPAQSSKILRDNNFSEDPLPEDIIRALCSRPVPEALTTSLAMGIILSPEEYQRLVLTQIQGHAAARDLYERRVIFAPSRFIDRSLSFGNTRDYSEDLRDKLLPCLHSRCIFEPIISRRFVQKLGHVGGSTAYTEENNSLLNQIAAGYNGYRVGAVSEIEKVAKSVTTNDVVLMSEVFDELSLFDSSFEKLASVADKALLLGILPLVYLYGAHVDRTRGAGGSVGPIDKFVSDHPLMTASAIAGISMLASEGKLNSSAFKDLLK